MGFGLTKVAGADLSTRQAAVRVAREGARAVVRDRREAVSPRTLRGVMRLYGVAPGLAQSLMQTMGIWRRGWDQNKGAV